MEVRDLCDLLERDYKDQNAIADITEYIDNIGEKLPDVLRMMPDNAIRRLNAIRYLFSMQQQQQISGYYYEISLCHWLHQHHYYKDTTVMKNIIKYMDCIEDLPDLLKRLSNEELYKLNAIRFAFSKVQQRQISFYYDAMRLNDRTPDVRTLSHANSEQQNNVYFDIDRSEAYQYSPNFMARKRGACKLPSVNDDLPIKVQYDRLKRQQDIDLNKSRAIKREIHRQNIQAGFGFA